MAMMAGTFCDEFQKLTVEFFFFSNTFG